MLNKTSLLGIIAATIAFIAVPAFAADTFLGEGDFVVLRSGLFQLECGHLQFSSFMKV